MILFIILNPYIMTLDNAEWDLLLLPLFD